MSVRTGGMRVATAAATDVAAPDVGRALVAQVRERLGPGPVQLAALFLSAHFEERVDEIAAVVHELLAPAALIGNTAEAVIADQREYEGQPAVSLWAARLPGARIRSLHFSQSDLERLNTVDDFREYVGVAADEPAYFIVLADAFSIDVLGLLGRIESAYPQRPVVGGMASGGHRPGENRLIFEGLSLRSGATAIALTGNIALDTVVSQGCRPIARHVVITRSERNVIHELGGRKALQVLQEILQGCNPRDVALAKQGGVFIGRAVCENKDVFSRGDFLIRNLLGWDAKSGSIQVNDHVRPGQTVQFHVRDAHSAAEDMRDLLGARGGPAADGALLFTCNGRGTRMFAEPNHDAACVAALRGALPLAGFFCMGEIGPIGTRNFVHGHTASIAFFRPALEASPA